MMKKDSNFNLEEHIKDWLRGFHGQRAFDEGALQEMELPVRDHIEDLLDQGFTEQRAFEKARKLLNTPML